MGINDIIAAISIKLNQAFGDGYTIYDDEVPQDIETPAFFILFLNTSRKRIMGTRSHRTTLFNIQYFGNGRVDISTRLDMLQNALETVTTLDGTVIRGTDINGEIVDGVGHLSVNYNMFLYDVEEKVFMESLEQHSARLKG